jgi:hypothetical protein
MSGGWQGFGVEPPLGLSIGESTHGFSIFCGLPSQCRSLRVLGFLTWMLRTPNSGALEKREKAALSFKISPGAYQFCIFCWLQASLKHSRVEDTHPAS